MFAIKKMRMLAGFTQQEVADELGIKKARYGDWERETREINLRDAIRLADLFGCTLDELAGRPWPRRGLSSDEQSLLDAYNDANAQGRDAIMAVASSGAKGRRFEPCRGHQHIRRSVDVSAGLLS